MGFEGYLGYKKYYKPNTKLIKFKDVTIGDVLQRELATIIKLSDNYNYNKGMSEQQSNAFCLNSGHYIVVHPESNWVLVKSLKDF